MTILPGSLAGASSQADGAPTAVAVTGAAGSIGLHFVRHLLARTPFAVRALVHRTALPPDLSTSRVVQIPGTLLDRESLERWLCPGAIVVHLAWSSTMTADEQVRAVTTLGDAAYRCGVARLVHCSTAVVAGRARAQIVTEDTPCQPANEYERTKYEAEGVIAAAAAGRFPLTILRPTAVFGAGLQNLVSLIASLRGGRGLANWARASLFGDRHLHLVPVETVVDALLYVALGRDRRRVGDATPGTYIVSADDQPGGDFRSVEARIRRGLGLGATLSPLPIPSSALRLVLAAVGRSDTNPRRIYDGSRLARAGFVPPASLAEAIDRYVAWHRSQVFTSDVM
jgi:nucleoside-diphosphate-sugar epimerase